MKVPATPAAMIMSTGGSRVVASSTMVATMMRPPFQTPGVSRTSSQQVDAIRPSATGPKPRCRAASMRSNWGRRPRRETTNGKTSAGSVMPRVVASAPCAPAICQPMTVTNRTFGPGAACARAIEFMNWVWLR